MGTSRITEVLDTSVLMHDEEAPKNFAEHVVLIPIMVSQELDDLRKSPDLNKRRSAQRAIRVLDEMGEKGDIRMGVPTPGGGILIMDAKNYSMNGVHLPESADNSILGVARKWQQCVHGQEQQKKGQGDKTIKAMVERLHVKDVHVISKDLGLRVKARALGLTVEDYTHDKTVRSKEDIYSGMSTVLVSDVNFQEFCGLLCENGSKGTTLKEFNGLISVPKLYPNQCCIFESSNGTDSILAIYKDNNKDEPHLVHVEKPPKAGRGIRPRNVGQAFAMALLKDPSISLVTLSGIAGTGKTLMPLLAGLEMLAKKECSEIVVYRPTNELGKEMGYLPGDIEEKFEPWMFPITDALELLENGGELDPGETKPKKPFFDTTGFLHSGKIKIQPINYIKGRSLHYRFVLVDEPEDFSPKEIKEVITRIGKRSKIVLAGDVTQIIDNYLDPTSNGLTHVIQNMRGEPTFGHITLTKSERSDLAELAAKRL
jgi:PhoH-like ATPase